MPNCGELMDEEGKSQKMRLSVQLKGPLDRCRRSWHQFSEYRAQYTVLYYR